MGYRSNIAAYFYVRQPYKSTQEGIDSYERAKGLFKVWWDGVCADPMYVTEFKRYAEVTEAGVLFRLDDVKWCDSYPDVQWFMQMMQRYRDDFIDNEELDGGSEVWKHFCMEYAVVGENYDDCTLGQEGYLCDFRLNISREIQISH
jgi:hypothetical protein